MKYRVEWRDGDVWRQATIQVSFSRHNNYWFKHKGDVYVFPTFKRGTDVMMKSGNKWVKPVF